MASKYKYSSYFYCAPYSLTDGSSQHHTLATQQVRRAGVLFLRPSVMELSPPIFAALFVTTDFKNKFKIYPLS